jgi:hypothetical protein
MSSAAVFWSVPQGWLREKFLLTNANWRNAIVVRSSFAWTPVSHPTFFAGLVHRVPLGTGVGKTMLMRLKNSGKVSNTHHGVVRAEPMFSTLLAHSYCLGSASLACLVPSPTQRRRSLFVVSSADSRAFSMGHAFAPLSARPPSKLQPTGRAVVAIEDYNVTKARPPATCSPEDGTLLIHHQPAAV